MSFYSKNGLTWDRVVEAQATLDDIDPAAIACSEALHRIEGLKYPLAALREMLPNPHVQPPFTLRPV